MSLCILTNASALFPPISPNTGRLIRSMSLSAGEHDMIMPSPEDFMRSYNELEREFNAILVLTASEALLPETENARLAAQSHGGMAKIEVLDTLQIGPGLGILAQAAARKAAAGAPLLEVEEYIRAIIPYLFTIICTDQPLFYKTENNHNPSGQANEPVNTLAIYSLEEGLLSLYKKVRTQRHLLETFQEFLEEFEKPQQFAYFHGKNASLHVRPLREAAGGIFPNIHFNDLDLNTTLSGLLGEHSVGMTVLEMPGEGWL
jgi:fatty acid-binding protein DegV